MTIKTYWHVAYIDDDGSVLGSDTIEASDHWEACELAWSQAPKGTDDFKMVAALPAAA